jgi:hypothetical protein
MQKCRLKAELLLSTTKYPLKVHIIAVMAIAKWPIWRFFDSFDIAILVPGLFAVASINMKM